MPTVVDVPEKDNQIAVVDEVSIRDRIHIIRGQQVMLDFDLAEIYGYTTKAFNQQVKRNSERFPDDFMFKLTADEIDELSRSQNVTSSWGGTRYLPNAFTEQGVYMLMTVLKGELAVTQSIALIRIFNEMKEYIANNKPLIGDKALQQLALQTVKNSNDIAEIKEEMVKVSDLPEIIRSFGFAKAESEYLILNGETVEANLAYKQIYNRAKKTIYIIDNYIGLRTLHLFRDITSTVKVTIFSDNLGFGLTKAEYKDFHTEYPNISVTFKETAGMFHDRFIIIDYGTSDEKIYHCGASSKDAGKRVTTISELSERAGYQPLISNLLSNPPLKLK